MSEGAPSPWRLTHSPSGAELAPAVEFVAPPLRCRPTICAHDDTRPPPRLEADRRHRRQSVQRGLAELVRKERFGRTPGAERSTLHWRAVARRRPRVDYSHLLQRSGRSARSHHALSRSLPLALYYCLRRAGPILTSRSSRRISRSTTSCTSGASPCRVLLGYLAFRFEWFRPYSDDGVLFIAGVFAVLAYRFDNRFVLSLALASIAGWFGPEAAGVRRYISGASCGVSALAYGAIVAGSGALMYRQGIKRHFLEAYLHIAANAIFAALVSGAGVRRSRGRCTCLALLVSSRRRQSCSASGSDALHSSPTAPSMAMPGSAATVLPILGSATAFLGYFFVTGSLVIVSLAVLARRFGRSE